jgi:hypothetical protein
MCRPSCQRTRDQDACRWSRTGLIPSRSYLACPRGPLFPIVVLSLNHEWEEEVVLAAVCRSCPVPILLRCGKAVACAPAGSLLWCPCLPCLPMRAASSLLAQSGGDGPSAPRRLDVGIVASLRRASGEQSQAHKGLSLQHRGAWIGASLKNPKRVGTRVGPDHVRDQARDRPGAY